MMSNRHPRFRLHGDPATRPSGDGTIFRPVRPRPEALMVTCTDCTLDAGPLRRWQRESLFLYRTAGNEVPDYGHADEDWLAVLDTALNVGEVPDVIVCGHSDCQAVRAERAARRADAAEYRVAGRAGRMDFLRLRVAEAAAVTEQAKANVLRQLDTLREYPLVGDRIAGGTLRLTGMVYLHESGTLLVYDQEAAEFRAVLGS
jgi:carbonic anhydrase